jgi:hypothetical protein
VRLSEREREDLDTLASRTGLSRGAIARAGIRAAIEDPQRVLASWSLTTGGPREAGAGGPPPKPPKNGRRRKR